MPQLKQAPIKEATNDSINFQGVNIRDECTRLKELLDEKMQVVQLLTSENQELKAQLEETRVRDDTAQAENKMLIDRWMLQKMQDAEKLNEHMMPPYGTNIHMLSISMVEYLHTHLCLSMPLGSYPFSPFVMPSLSGVAIESSGNTPGSRW